MAIIYANNQFTTENLLDAICDYLGVCVVDNEKFLSSWSNGNPIKIEAIRPIVIKSSTMTNEKEVQ